MMIEQIIHTIPFRRDQCACLPHIIVVGKHDLSGNRSQRTDTPGILSLIDRTDQIPVSGDRIAETKPRSRKEFTGATQNDQIIIILCQRNRSNLCYIRSKFHISLIDHNKNAVLLADIQNTTHLFVINAGRGRIIRIADDQHIDRII